MITPWPPAESSWTSLLRQHRLWYRNAIGYLAVAAVCALAIAFDDRLFAGISVWIKPAKLALSISVYFATLALFSERLGGEFFRTWPGRFMTWLPIVCAAFEMLYIMVQAAQGQASHFNYSSNYHSIMYGLMGFGAVTMVLIGAWMGIAILARHGSRDAMTLAISVGLILTFILGGGFGGYLSGAGSHWVGGVASDAQGLPLVGWATAGGDLRVAHFWGIHAMQIVPAVVWPFRNRNWASAVVWVAAIAVTAISAATFWQAINGQAFVSSGAAGV